MNDVHLGYTAMEIWVNILKAYLESLAYWVWEWAKAWVTFNFPRQDECSRKIGERAIWIGQHIWNGAQLVYQAALDWVSPWINSILDTITSVWDSITSVWARFGADILETAHTVVSWVTEAANNVWYWVLARYEDARTWASDAWEWVKSKAGIVWEWIQSKSAAVWDWIATKSTAVWDWISLKANVVWDWIRGPGDQIESWQAFNAAYYEDLRETHGNRLLAFLQDPGGFILEYILDSIEWLVSEIVYRYW